MGAPIRAPASDPDNDGDSLLEANETWRYTCTYAVPAHSDSETNDPILNTASVTGDDLDGDAVTGDDSDQVSVNITHDAGTLTIVKDADVLDVAHGGTVTYTFDVTYLAGTDGSPATNLDVSDDQCDLAPAPTLAGGFNVGDSDLDGLLDQGETWEYTCSFAVPAGHLNGEEDPILNTASVSGDDLDGDAVTGDDSEPGQRQHHARCRHTDHRQERRRARRGPRWHGHLHLRRDLPGRHRRLTGHRTCGHGPQVRQRPALD